VWNVAHVLLGLLGDIRKAKRESDTDMAK
jgi:hypothetical protein